MRYGRWSRPTITGLVVNLTAFRRGETRPLSTGGDGCDAGSDADGMGPADDRAPGKKRVIIRALRERVAGHREKEGFTREGVTDVIVVDEMERTEVEAGVLLEELVSVSDFLRDDRAGGGACTRGGTPS